MTKPTKVAKSSRLSTGGSVAVINTSHVQQFLRHRRTDNASTARCWDKTYKDTATLACHLQQAHKQ